MKTGLVILAIGFISLVVVLICVASIVTSTTQGAKWIEDVGKSGPDEDSPPSDIPRD
jgi:hypothetical protein